MDELHILALEVARRILESEDEDAATVQLARALLEEVERRPTEVRVMRPAEPGA